MNTAKSQEEQDLYALIAETETNLSVLQKRLRAIETEFESVAPQKERYELLATVCSSLDRLHELGADDLFWGESVPDADGQLDRARRSVAAFSQSIEGLEQSRKKVEQGIEEQSWKLETLSEELKELKEKERLRLDEFVIEREESALPYRPTAMPWSKQGEDERRFRKVLLLTLLVSFLFGYTTHYWTLPMPDPEEPVEIPERLAKLVKKSEPPPPPPKKEEKKEPDTEKEKTEKKEKKEPKPTPAEKQKARKTAESSGVLAFKNSFADLIDNAPDAELGADARVNDVGKKAEGGQTQRSIVTSAAKSGSGGIDSAALSRDVGGGGEAGVTGVAFSRVDSAIGTDMKDGADRPLSDGPGPSRTDEEIQIVFDRYKATLYRIYNKELRKDPTLQGKLVLRMTIEPDGTVSAVRSESSDLGSKELVAQIVARVGRFNFGPKEGVPAVTILYPIDFLPAS
ncbi:AgmX/PglI C-terminal domain-containing protein [Thiohalomonas denitrificans]|uniref:TonB family C-terminal domain-containing protein n=1 Tax=Thiohalomonas denitrificans TaxID=415747 RepID=A0A1G5QS30_9GAMM|nr:AgmX/PglI C-terminal domain-containing protein [Thiohalomonas denitrificans]SCZ64643.1 hypothetical protein SAMN03097708_02679 [Thiohalomonas denitrificans]